MRKSTRPLIIASRPSRLAKAQAQAVARQLAVLDPSLRIDFRWVESEGDKLPDAPLTDVGGKGLFVRAIEKCLLDGSADLAVHSLKDLPVAPRPELTLAVTPRRADARDCLISAAAYPSIEALPPGARIGTSSPRRQAQLLALRPDLQVLPLRGNIDTRLRKVLEEKQFDAALLAVAGLQRADLAQHAVFPIPVESILPAAAQGTLGLQCRIDDHVTIRRCLPLNHAESGITSHAERQIIQGLAADCYSPIAVLAQIVAPNPQDDIPSSRQDRGLPRVRIRVRVLSADGKQCIQADDLAPTRHVGKLVKRILVDLKSRGALDLLAH